MHKRDRSGPKTASGFALLNKCHQLLADTTLKHVFSAVTYKVTKNICTFKIIIKSKISHFC